MTKQFTTQPLMFAVVAQFIERNLQLTNAVEQSYTIQARRYAVRITALCSVEDTAPIENMKSFVIVYVNFTYLALLIFTYLILLIFHVCNHFNTLRNKF